MEAAGEMRAATKPAGTSEMSMEQNFRIPQKAAIKNGAKYLILKRAPDSDVYPNRWDFPGGRLEHGEKPEKGLEREVREETGLRVEVKSPEFVFCERINGHFNYHVIFGCRLSGKNAAVKLSGEHTGHRWAAKKEILKLKTENYLRAYLKRGE